LRRCEHCRIGFSNSSVPGEVVRIFKDPLHNIPVEVHDGVLETLAKAVNLWSRDKKRIKFGFETSEDAVTWTVFKYLQNEKKLRKTCPPPLCSSTSVEEPAMLLWGVPVPGNDCRANEVAGALLKISDKLKEDPDFRSEPDVVLDFGADGVLIIEVKYRSKNADKWGKGKYYLESKAFNDPELAQKTNLYELVRNWRFAWELASGRPMALVNLGPETLFNKKAECALRDFEASLRQDESHRFVRMKWSGLLSLITPKPKWFSDFILNRPLLNQ